LFSWLLSRQTSWLEGSLSLFPQHLHSRQFLHVLLQWDGLLSLPALQDLAVGRVLAPAAVALHNAPFRPELVAPLEEVRTRPPIAMHVYSMCSRQLVLLLPRSWVPSGQSAAGIALKMALAPLTTLVINLATSAKSKGIPRYVSCPPWTLFSFMNALFSLNPSFHPLT
jgi:hypothetical protein